MDKVDQNILRLLQTDCRQSIAELAEKSGLSASACHRRIGVLQEKGVIDSYVANLNGAALGYKIEFFVEVSLNAQQQDSLEQFEKAVQNVPEILECHLMTGTADYLLRVAAKDTKDYERIHRDYISNLPDISRIESSLVLRAVKPWAGYPIK